MYFYKCVADVSPLTLSMLVVINEVVFTLPTTCSTAIQNLVYEDAFNDSRVQKHEVTKHLATCPSANEFG